MEDRLTPSGDVLAFTTAPLSIATGQPSQVVRLQLQDGSGKAVTATSNVTVNLSSTFIRQVLGERIPDGTFVPRALAEELLQPLFIVLLALIDALQAFGHGVGAFASALEQQAAEVAFVPGTSPLTAEVRKHVLQVPGEITLKAMQAFGVHGADRLWATAQLATTTNGVILEAEIVGQGGEGSR